MAGPKTRVGLGTVWALGLTAGLLAGTTTVMAQGMVDGPAVAWDLATHTPKGNPAMSGMEAMAESVSARTGGKFAIKIHWGGTLTPVRETTDALKIGAFQIGLIVQSFHPGKIPTTNVFDLPFLHFGDIQNQVMVQKAYLNLPEVAADAGRWNIRLLMPALLPPFELAGKGKTPSRIDDLKGLRIRASGGLGEALKTVGVVSSNLTSSELYMGLERGMIDGLAIGVYGHASYRTQELLTWYTDNLELGIVSSYIAINNDAWNGLPAQYRKLIDDLVDPSQEKGIPVLLTANQKILDEFKARNLAHVQFSKADRDRLVELGARPVWDKWVADMNAAGHPGQKLLDFVLTEGAKGAKKATN